MAGEKLPFIGELSLHRRDLRKKNLQMKKP
jgi:hypothetical protein